MRGAKALSSLRSVLCRVYWYCALLIRPPTRTSCTACRKRVAPGTWASFPRRRWITRSTETFRSPHGLSTTNMRPVFVGLPVPPRSEEHTSELQSRVDLVCRLLLEKKKQKLTH